MILNWVQSLAALHLAQMDSIASNSSAVLLTLPQLVSPDRPAPRARRLRAVAQSPSLASPASPALRCPCLSAPSAHPQTGAAPAGCPPAPVQACAVTTGNPVRSGITNPSGASSLGAATSRSMLGRAIPCACAGGSWANTVPRQLCPRAAAPVTPASRPSRRSRNDATRSSSPTVSALPPFAVPGFPPHAPATPAAPLFPARAIAKECVPRPRLRSSSDCPRQVQPQPRGLAARLRHGHSLERRHLHLRAVNGEVHGSDSRQQRHSHQQHHQRRHLKKMMKCCLLMAQAPRTPKIRNQRKANPSHLPQVIRHRLGMIVTPIHLRALQLEAVLQLGDRRVNRSIVRSSGSVQWHEPGCARPSGSPKSHAHL